jgi:hypothetical protein
MQMTWLKFFLMHPWLQGEGNILDENFHSRILFY